jgi:spermidine synthase
MATVVLYKAHGAAFAAGWAVTSASPAPTMFAVVALFVGVPSMAASGSFPLLAAAIVRAADERTRNGGPVYAAHLVGAGAGVLVGGVLLPARYGNLRAIQAAAAVAGLAGLVALLAPRLFSAAPLPQRLPEPASPATPHRLGATIVVASGLLSVALELELVAAFRQCLIASVYVFAGVLTGCMAGLAVGAAIASAVRRRGVPVDRALTCALIGSAVALACAPMLFRAVSTSGLFAQGPADAAAVATMMAKIVALAVPVVVPAGTVFPLAWEAFATATLSQGRALARATLVNDLGAAAGALLVPFALIPAVGVLRAFVVTAAAYLALAAATSLRPGAGHRAVLAATGVAIAASFAGAADPVVLAPGERVVAHYHGRGDLVDVVDDASGSRHIVVDQRYTLNGTGSALATQRHEGWLPVFFARSPIGRSLDVVFIGMASGISAAATLDFPIGRLRAIELLPEVVRAARRDFGTWNAALFSDPRVEITVDDGRTFLARSPGGHDVIIVDLMLPQHEASAALYAQELLRIARDRLVPGGLLALWLPLHQLDDQRFAIVARTLLSVFPDVIAVRANFSPTEPVIGLFASTAPFELGDEDLAARLASPFVRNLATQSPWLRSVANVRALLAGDVRGASARLPNAPLTTDDQPAFAFAGALALAPGTALRGFTLLGRFASEWAGGPFPSCQVGWSELGELTAGIRAGNHLYAAAVAGVELGTEADRARRRAVQRRHVEIARALLPLDLSFGEPW